MPDIAAYDRVYKRLISGTQISDVSSSFAMEELKFTTALPLTEADYASRVLQSNKPVVVKFGSKTCGPCAPAQLGIACRHFDFMSVRA